MTRTVNLRSILYNIFTPYETLSLISPKKSIQAGGNLETKFAELTFGILKCFHNAVLNYFPPSLHLSYFLRARNDSIKQEKRAEFFFPLLGRKWLSSTVIILSFLFPGYALRKWPVSKNSSHASFWQKKKNSEPCVYFSLGHIVK